MIVLQTSSNPNLEVIDTEEKLFTILAECGRDFAEHQLLSDPSLVLCFEWIEFATAQWRVRIPNLLDNYEIEYDRDDIKRAVIHFMTAAMTRLDELTGRGRQVQEATA